MKARASPDQATLNVLLAASSEGIRVARRKLFSTLPIRSGWAASTATGIERRSPAREARTPLAATTTNAKPRAHPDAITTRWETRRDKVWSAKKKPACCKGDLAI